MATQPDTPRQTRAPFAAAAECSITPASSSRKRKRPDQDNYRDALAPVAADGRLNKQERTKAKKKALQLSDFSEDDAREERQPAEVGLHIVEDEPGNQMYSKVIIQAKRGGKKATAHKLKHHLIIQNKIKEQPLVLEGEDYETVYDRVSFEVSPGGDKVFASELTHPFVFRERKTQAPTPPTDDGDDLSEEENVQKELPMKGVMKAKEAVEQNVAAPEEKPVRINPITGLPILYNRMSRDYVEKFRKEFGYEYDAFKIPASYSIP